MKHPAYHLRPYKAVDRALLIEVLKRLDTYLGFSSPDEKYTYYSLGGPFLEDFRLLQQYFPDIKLVSIEGNRHTFKRQKFHHPSKRIQLVHKNFSDFIAQTAVQGPSIFWLDYVDSSYQRFDEFRQVLTLVEEGSIVKITLQAELRDWRLEADPKTLSDRVCDRLHREFVSDYRLRFGRIAPRSLDISLFRRNMFPKLLQDMLQITAENALPASAGVVFQPLASTTYSDKTQMLSLVGVVCSPDACKEIRGRMRPWRFANLDWSEPTLISLPMLSVKERLLLEKYLPETKPDGKSLLKALGYNIDQDKRRSLKMMQQYSECHAHYPHFARVIVV
jgi:hypothetical protein